MANTIVCPSCGKPLEITEALRSQLEAEMMGELTKKHEAELASVKKATEEKLRKELAEETTLELSDLKKQLEEKDKKVKDMISRELELRDEKRKLEEREKELTLEVTRRIDEEKKKIEESILKQAAEEHRLKDLEKEKKIADMEKLVEELKRKAQQGSQQLQGEVQELDLELSLREAFPEDLIEEVEKGVRGADIRQIVRTLRGNVCGIILWESKRTKAWSDEWLSKLKDDLRAEKAHIPIIISSALPEEAKGGFCTKDGVIVSNYALALSVASLLRQKLIDQARERFIAQNRGTKADQLYEFIMGHEFKQQIEAIAEVYMDMQKEILRERAAFEKIWKTREAQITKLMTSTSGIIGSIRGRVGSTFPQIKGVDLADGDGDGLKLLET